MGIHAISLIQRYRPERRGNRSIPDVRWLSDAGRNGWLVVSCNKDILNVAEERETLERERVGIVFLTSGQENSAAVLRLLLNKIPWLEAIDREIPRPFVYLVNIRGHVESHPIAPLIRKRRPLLSRNR